MRSGRVLEGSHSEATEPASEPRPQRRTMSAASEGAHSVSDDDTIPPGGTGFDDGDEARPTSATTTRLATPRPTTTRDPRDPTRRPTTSSNIARDSAGWSCSPASSRWSRWPWASRSGDRAGKRPPRRPRRRRPPPRPPPRSPRSDTRSRSRPAKVPSLSILRDPPAGWDTTAASVRWDQPEPPSSIGSLPERPALPRPDYPLAGRYSSDTGWAFSNPTSFGGPLTLMVTEQRGDWLKVEVPVRPNGTDGYVKAERRRPGHDHQAHRAPRR